MSKKYSNALIFLVCKMLEPTPGLFYSIINEAFGSRATFATRAIASIQIVPDDSDFVQTLAVGKDGVIFVNGGFWKKMVRTRVDAEIVLLHELFHVITGDVLKLKNLQPWERQLANLSMDMRINAAIVLCFMNTKSGYNKITLAGGKDILQRMYPSTGISGLLRPNSGYSKQSKYKLIYNSLYTSERSLGYEADEKAKQIFKSEESIRRALEILLPKDQRNKLTQILYIGNHGEKQGEEADDSKIDPEHEHEDEIKPSECSAETKEQIREALKGHLKEQDPQKMAGIGALLVDNMLQVIESSREINLKALDKFTCNHKVNKIKSMFEKERKVTSIVPIRPTSRDMGLVAAGIIPPFWHNVDKFQSHKNKNIAIYLDVSGSVTCYLPKLLGIIKNLHKGIQTIYCFSNFVSEHSVQELTKGQYKSSGGTDFDCIGKHVLENEIDKAVIFTDGYADLYSVKPDVLKKQLQDAAVVYFGEHVNKNNFFAREYKKSFDLDEIS